MKTSKRVMCLFLIATLIVLAFVLFASADERNGVGTWDGTTESPLDLDLYTVVPFVDVPFVMPTLQPGQIWTGRTVRYNFLTDDGTPAGNPVDAEGNLLPPGKFVFDGTATARLYVWGASYGSGLLPLDAATAETSTVHLKSSFNELCFLDEPQFKIVPDDTIGIYYANDAASGGKYNFGEDHYIVWSVPQDVFLGADEPIYAEVLLWLEEPPGGFEMGRWYTSGTSEAWFYPTHGNPYYWTQQVVTEEVFSVPGISWNANGINAATIIDNQLEITITFGRCNAGQSANNANVGSATYNYSLTRDDSGTFWFTVYDLEGPGKNVIYEAVTGTTGGGNSALGGTRTVTSTNYMKRPTTPTTPATPIIWSTDPARPDAVVHNMGGGIQMQLLWSDAPTGGLTLHKSLAGYYEIDWGVTDDTEFTMILRVGNGMFATFDFENGVYIYTGRIAERERATAIHMSKNTPAVLLDIPVADNANPEAEPWLFAIEEIFDYAIEEWEDSLDLITYAVYDSEENALENGTFTLTKGESTDITVQNTFGHGVGFMRVFKTLEGYPADSDVNRDTVFYVRIWDVEAENFLLFDPVPREIYANETDPIDRNTLWCVGNSIVGLTESFTGTPIMEIPITANTPLRLSNLWTWSAYEVVEVVRADGNEVNEAFFNDWNAFWDGKPSGEDRDFTWADRFHGTAIRPMGERYTKDTDFYWGGGIWINEAWEARWIEAPEIKTDAFGIETDTWGEDHDWVWGARYYDNAIETLHFNKTLITAVGNRYKYESGSLLLTKEIVGNAIDWGVNENTPFYIQIWSLPDSENPMMENLMIFEPLRISGEQGYIYRTVGHKYDKGDGTFGYVYYWLDQNDVDFAAPMNYVEEIIITPSLAQKVIDLPIYLLGEENHFFIQEVFREGAVTDHITTTYVNRDALNNEIHCNIAPENSPGGVSLDFVQNRETFVTVTNEYTIGTGEAVVAKVFPQEEDFMRHAFPDTWAITNDTTFYATMSKWFWDEAVVDELVEDPTTGRKFYPGVTLDGGYPVTQDGIGWWEVLVFEHQTSSGLYQWNGESVAELSSDGAQLFPFSVNVSAFLTDLPTDGIYKLTEYWYDAATGTYVQVDIADTIGNSDDPWMNYWVEHKIFFYDEAGNEITRTEAYALAEDIGMLRGTAPVKVYNNFRPGVAELVVTKVLENVPTWMDVGDDTDFQIQVRDVTDDNYLLWQLESSDENSITWRCVGNAVDGLSDPIEYDDSIQNYITVSGSKTAILNNLWSNREYMMYEYIDDAIGGGHYTPEIVYEGTAGNRIFLANGDRFGVTVTNSFPTYYTVSYDAGDGTGAPNDGSYYLNGQSVAVASSAPEREHFIFLGWLSDISDDDTLYVGDDTFTIPDNNVVLTAQWTRDPTAPDPNSDPNPDPDPNPGSGPGSNPDPGPGPGPGPTPGPGPDPTPGPGTNFGPGVNLGPGTDLGLRISFTTDHYAYFVGDNYGLIRPHDSITRAEIATIFFRLITDEYRAAVWSKENSFSDVAIHHWYNNAVSTMVNAEIFVGLPDGTFAPKRPITRAEFAMAASRFLNSDYNGPNLFPDIDGHWAQDAINAVAERGWSVGLPDGTFAPDREITRAEVATLMNRILKRHPETADDLLDGMILWPDNMNENAWFYLALQEATNSSDYELKDDGHHKYWTSLIPNRQWHLLELPKSEPHHINGS